jgi:arsenate reductase (thioredoxin)
MDRKNILVLCTANSCRSQMAEGYLKFYAGNKAQIYSAGTTPQGVHRKTLSVMYEEGIDLRGHTSNHIDEYAGIPFDYIITVCDEAPDISGAAKRVHYNFPDPSSVNGPIEEIREEFRRVRDMIKAFSRDFVAENLCSQS